MFYAASTAHLSLLVVLIGALPAWEQAKNTGAMQVALSSEWSPHTTRDRPPSSILPKDLEANQEQLTDNEPRDNTSQPQSDTENVITLGQPQNAPYVVVIPGAQEPLLDQVQERIPQAFFTDSRRGRYIQAGAFPTYSEAADLNAQLRDDGFDARVIYLRVR